MEHPTTYAERVCTKIRDAIDQAGISEREVARRTGIPPASLNRYTRGLAKKVDVSDVYRIAKAIDADVRDLLPDEVVL